MLKSGKTHWKNPQVKKTPLEKSRNPDKSHAMQRAYKSLTAQADDPYIKKTQRG